jgi:hypothetical protein
MVVGPSLATCDDADRQHVVTSRTSAVSSGLGRMLGAFEIFLHPSRSNRLPQRSTPNNSIDVPTSEPSSFWWVDPFTTPFGAGSRCISASNRRFATASHRYGCHFDWHTKRQGGNADSCPRVSASFAEDVYEEL